MVTMNRWHRTALTGARWQAIRAGGRGAPSLYRPGQPGMASARHDLASDRTDVAIEGSGIGSRVDAQRVAVPGAQVWPQLAEHHVPAGDEPLIDPVVKRPLPVRERLGQQHAVEPAIAVVGVLVLAAAQRQDVRDHLGTA